MRINHPAQEISALLGEVSMCLGEDQDGLCYGLIHSVCDPQVLHSYSTVHYSVAIHGLIGWCCYGLNRKLVPLQRSSRYKSAIPE